MDCGTKIGEWKLFTILFSVLVLIIFGKMLGFALKLSWGIVKILLTVVLLPLVLIGLVAVGLVYVAVPILIVVGLCSMIGFKGK